MREVIGYFITWTCYGTWLPGDQRGWTDWHQGWKTANPKLEVHARSAMTEAAVELNDLKRRVVESTITKHCEVRGWHLWTKNCRTNHVHVVVTAREYDGETVRNQLKAWCTRNLKTHFDPAKKNWWTEGGYVRVIDNEVDLAAAIQYTNEAQ